MADRDDGTAQDAALARAERQLIAAADAFDILREEVADLLHELRLGQTERSKKLAPLMLDLAKAVAVLARAGELVDDVRRRSGARLAGDGLDLAAARAEVERRLADLRAAG